MVHTFAKGRMDTKGRFNQKNPLKINKNTQKMNETIPINMVNRHKLSQYLNYKSLQVNDFKACYPNLQLQQGPILKYSVAAPPQKIVRVYH